VVGISDTMTSFISTPENGDLGAGNGSMHSFKFDRVFKPEST